MPDFSSPTVLTLLVKDGCSLCQDAREVVAQVGAEFGLGFSELSIVVDGEPLPEYQQYLEELPVLLIDGVQRDFWRIDPERLRRLLRARQ
ncbi:hypothetical protein FHU41_001797 [Psychromicrobium silvestre]|uniref:Glutaredoxin-like domain (DUF836) n=1 Tax=Psychromicrobium silvestre TaxID=1645614 RepID=A0A7Y9LTY1_9MICC|nr:glutaredoxin family protein [Psychromicrobium silvestre]NYE95547.1 hypothetical protein [Psychromicrobium silvestre]